MAKDDDKRMAARLRRLQALETKAERKRETRRKIIIGAMVRAAQQSDSEISLRWLHEQIQARTRPDERGLFGLEDKPSASATGVDKAESAAAAPAAPITSRQKNLLTKLVEEHPELVRELGIDPEEPRLDDLSKAKATSLISAVLDRVKGQEPPADGGSPRDA